MKMNCSAFLLILLMGLISCVQGTRPNAAMKLSYASPPKYEKSYSECADETKVDPDLVLQLRSGNWKGDHNVKLFVHCVLVKNGLMSEQAVFQMDVAFGLINTQDPEKRRQYEANIDKCLPQTDDLAPEISWRFAKCYHLVAPEYSLF